MASSITDNDRLTMLRLSVSKVEGSEIRGAIGRLAGQLTHLPGSVVNALNALRKHRDPAAAVSLPQYRAAVPYVALAIAEPCLAEVIEALGDDAEDPTRDQLVGALDSLGGSFPSATVAAMLAHVASEGMPSSDLCFELLATEERFGLTGWDESEGAAGESASSSASASRSVPASDGGTTAEQRERRRLKKQEAADERKRKQEAARKAAELVRRSRRDERMARNAGRATGAATGPGAGAAPGALVDSRPRSAPIVRRPAALTPAQEEEFDRDDPWVSGVVFAWVPFGADDDDQSGLEGKSRRCVVVAGSETWLLVRPGYSEGGVRSRDWKAVPLAQWSRAGFDQPTFIDIELVKVTRDHETTPVGWLATEDWNALW